MMKYRIAAILVISLVSVGTFAVAATSHDEPIAEGENGAPPAITPYSLMVIGDAASLPLSGLVDGVPVVGTFEVEIPFGIRTDGAWMSRFGWDQGATPPVVTIAFPDESTFEVPAGSRLIPVGTPAHDRLPTSQVLQPIDLPGGVTLQALIGSAGEPALEDVPAEDVRSPGQAPNQ